MVFNSDRHNLTGTPSKRFTRFILPVALVFFTYFYFLLFAQFAFLHYLTNHNFSTTTLKGIMAMMATGGIASSLIVGYRIQSYSSDKYFKSGLILCCIAPWLTISISNIYLQFVTALIIGSGLGILTISVIQLLSNTRNPYAIGIGTGLGYAICNLPPLFNATAYHQVLFSGIISIIFLLLFLLIIKPNPHTKLEHIERKQNDSQQRHKWIWVYLFFILIWLDSACFYLIQENVSLKQNTWGTEGQILMNSIIHLIFAILAVYSLKKTSALTTLLISFVCLLFGASLLILEIDHRIWVSIPYTAGVSFYSVALVCVAVRCLTLYSAFFVALLYAISGWIGSAMGIGMVQDLNKIPPSFVGITAVLFIPIVFWNLTQQKKV